MRGRPKGERAIFVNFFCVGLFFVENVFRRVESREISRLSMPSDAFAFRFFDLILTPDSIRKIRKEDFTHCRCFNFSPKYFYGGKIYGIEGLKKDFFDDYPLVVRLTRKIKKTKSQKAILCRTGNWQLFADKDFLLEIE